MTSLGTMGSRAPGATRLRELPTGLAKMGRQTGEGPGLAHPPGPGTKGSTTSAEVPGAAHARQLG